uniref:Transcription cofactor vestigial-like protein 4 n=1 Tax=Knipowitschia caucasica TaxID=637954 RepID=A0AAV2M4A7_KNICA
MALAEFKVVGEGALRADPRLQALSLSSLSSRSSPSSLPGQRTGPPPVSPTKRKLSSEHPDSDLDDNEHVTKMSRLFAAQLKPSGDYRSSKDRSRTPPERLVMPSALHSYHPHLPHLPMSALSLEQPLALTKNSENTRLSAMLPHPVLERQQNRPSVITCAPANNRNCHLSHCPGSHSNCSNLSNNFRRIHSNTACDPVIEEHFRRSLGKNYKEPEPTVAAGNSVSITGSVDDHFAKALGDTWLQIKNRSSSSSSGSSPNSSPHNSSPLSHSPALLS